MTLLVFLLAVAALLTVIGYSDRAFDRRIRRQTEVFTTGTGFEFVAMSTAAMAALVDSMDRQRKLEDILIGGMRINVVESKYLPDDAMYMVDLTKMPPFPRYNIVTP